MYTVMTETNSQSLGDDMYKVMNTHLLISSSILLQDYISPHPPRQVKLKKKKKKEKEKKKKKKTSQGALNS